jgi:hypothetical protein
MIFADSLYGVVGMGFACSAWILCMMRMLMPVIQGNREAKGFDVWALAFGLGVCPLALGFGISGDTLGDA